MEGRREWSHMPLTHALGKTRKKDHKFEASQKTQEDPVSKRKSANYQESWQETVA